MTNTQLIINLSPSMLSVAYVKKGMVVQDERLDLDPRQWESVWDDGLLRLDQSLRQLMSRFSSRSFPRATVVYHSPTLVQQVYSFELGAAEARDAAVAKIRETVGFHNPVETCTISQSCGEATSTTTVVYSEKEEQLRALYAWLNRCHLSVKSLVPTSTAVMSLAADIAISSGPVSAVFYLGADVSVIAYASSSGLKLIRSADIGYRTLMEGYLHAIVDQNRGASGDDGVDADSDSSDSRLVDQVQCAADAREATKMLFEHGIPLTEVEAEGFELRSTVLPSLAPVLQRFCIEIKQTLKFGLGESDMPKYLTVAGPGAAIPHLSKSISQHLDMHIKVDPSGADYSPMARFGVGDPGWLMIQSNNPPGGLLPDIANEMNLRKKLTQGLAAGVAVAVLFMGIEYGFATTDYQRVSLAIEQDSPRINSVNEFHNQLGSASHISRIIGDVSGLVVETVDSIPQWHSVLVEISGQTPGSVQINEIRGNDTNGTTLVEIKGLAVAQTEKMATQELNQYVSSLKALEGVSDVTLGATSRISVGQGQWGRQFALTVSLVRLPLTMQAYADTD